MKFFRIVFIVGVLLVWYSTSAVFIGANSGNDADSADVAIVLGAAAYGTRPSPLFRARIEHAINLYHEGRVEKLMFVGGIGDRSSFSEAAVARNFAVVRGVSAADILLEESSINTRENLAFSAEILAATDLNSVLLVSTPSHMRRALFVARMNGLDVMASPTQLTRWLPNGNRPNLFTREIVAYLHHRILWPWL